MRRLWVLLLFSEISVSGAEPHPCPVMNAASASGYLEGPVQETTTCSFSGPGASLTIDVSSGHDLTPYLKKCAAGAEPLKAIGNEAFACPAKGKGEIAAGRVRDQIFVVTLVQEGKPEFLREKVRKAAEQVAGNLY